MSAKIILVRHGETPYNIQRKFQGSADIPLNDKGRIQAGYARSALSDIHLDAIYSSPLVRAVETAEIIRGDRDIGIQKISNLREMTVGSWEGFTISEINNKYPQQYSIWQNTPEKFRLEGAETLKEVCDRSVEAICKIAIENEGKTALVVSHICCISTIMLTFANIDIGKLWEHPVKNASLNILKFSSDGAVKIEAWNDISHIPEEAAPMIPLREKEQALKK